MSYGSRLPGCICCPGRDRQVNRLVDPGTAYVSCFYFRRALKNRRQRQKNNLAVNVAAATTTGRAVL
ncbi:MAG: hypothetical protein K6T65_10140 [Peptococcaceae bacterium]|nr:hypothetical protein [Peptococcaceae bacterium]